MDPLEIGPPWDATGLHVAAGPGGGEGGNGEMENQSYSLTQPTTDSGKGKVTAIVLVLVHLKKMLMHIPQHEFPHALQPPCILWVAGGGASLRGGGLQPRHLGIRSDEPRGGEQRMRVGSDDSGIIGVGAGGGVRG